MLGGEGCFGQDLCAKKTWTSENSVLIPSLRTRNHRSEEPVRPYRRDQAPGHPRPGARSPIRQPWVPLALVFHSSQQSSLHVEQHVARSSSGRSAQVESVKEELSAFLFDLDAAAALAADGLSAAGHAAPLSERDAAAVSAAARAMRRAAAAKPGSAWRAGDSQPLDEWHAEAAAAAAAAKQQRGQSAAAQWIEADVRFRHDLAP